MRAAANSALTPNLTDADATKLSRQMWGNDKQAVHYSSNEDTWETPEDLFDALNKQFGFELDVCALPATAKCKRYFTPQDDGLSQEWTGVCWMNPPYGDVIGKWVEKASSNSFVMAVSPSPPDCDATRRLSE